MVIPNGKSVGVGKVGLLSLIKRGNNRRQLLRMYEDTIFELSIKLLSNKEIIVIYIEFSYK